MGLNGIGFSSPLLAPRKEFVQASAAFSPAPLYFGRKQTNIQAPITSWKSLQTLDPTTLDRDRLLAALTAIQLYRGPFAHWPIVGVLSFQKDPIVQSHSVRIANLSPEWEGAKVLHISDLHVHAFDKGNYWKKVLQMVQQQKPEVILFTGDAIHEHLTFLPEVYGFLKALPTDIPKVAVLGNHDYLDGQKGKWVRAILQDTGFTVLENAHTQVFRPGVKGAKDPLYVSGVSDTQYGENVALAVSGVPSRAPHIHLSHRPDYAMEQGFESMENKPSLVLSGHYHGGQIRLWPLNAIARWLHHGKETHYHGLKPIGEGSILYNNSGAGSGAVFHNHIGPFEVKFHIPPIRIRTDPELVMLTLTGKEG